jgi:hypothetical protein
VIGLLASGLLFPSSLAMGQWQLGLELATHSYHGTSRDTSDSTVTFHLGPGGGLSYTLSIGRNWRRFGATLRLAYANPGLAASAPGFTISDKRTGALLESALLLGTRVGGIGPSGAVRIELGPSLHLWNFGEYRTRVGAVGGLTYAWPVAGRFTGNLRVEGMLSPSWLDAAEVPSDVERLPTWRYGVGVGLRYRLT